MFKLMKPAALILFLVGLNACSKDDITVEKNESTSWEIDKAIVDDDIRTRLGYDPREQQAYFSNPEGDLPIISFGNIPVGDSNTLVVMLKFTQEVTTNLSASLVYDASLFDKVKNNYPDFELGDPSLVSIAQNQVAVPQNARQVPFTFSVSNSQSLNKKLILPFALKLSNPDTKILTGSDVFVLKVYPEEVTFTPELSTAEMVDGISRTVRKNVVTGNYTVDNENIDITFATNTSITEDLKLQLIVDTTPDPFLAPAGTYIVGEKQSMQGVQRVTLRTKLQNLSLFTQPLCVLPLKLVIYDAQGNQHQTNQTFNVTINLKDSYPDDLVVGSNSNTVPSGTKVAKNEILGGFSLDSYDRGINFDNAIDGDEDTFAEFNTSRNSTALDFAFFDFFSFGKKNIKTIRIKMDDSTPITMVRVRIMEDALQDPIGTNIGVATFSSTNGWYVITLKQAVSVSSLRLVDFLNNGNKGTFKVKEVEFYEE